MPEFKITADDVYSATEGGKAVFLYFYPQSAAGFSGHKNFRLRSDDKKPSCNVFRSKDGNWLIQDKGGSDTKAYNAITLVQREMNLTYPQAIEWIAQNFAPDLLERGGLSRQTATEAECSEAEPVDYITVQMRASGQFTSFELEVLGHIVHEPDGTSHPFITQEDCADLCLVPLDSYTTAKNAKGKSYRFSGTDAFPMYAYDYGTYGKIYQPFHAKYRFLWYGSQKDKHDMPLSGEREFMARWRGIMDGSWQPETTVPSEDGGKEVKTDNRWDSLVICSGPSDALNIHHAGYHVCWPNSETADLTEFQMKALEKMAHELYICYDIDETGIRNMYRAAMQYIGLKIIRLPDDLKNRRARNGKPAKDAKDFFSYYRKPEIQDPVKLFNDLVKISGGLQFWQERWNAKSRERSFDINNDQLYAFLEASGFYTIETTSNTKGFTFCHIEGNIVRLIGEDSITGECTRFLLEYLRTHTRYYSQALVNAIHRSNQISAAKLATLRRIKPDFSAFTEEWDYFFFRNRIVRVGSAGIETVRPADCPYMTYESKIIDHDFEPETPFFDITFTPEYADLRDRLSAAAPSTPTYYALRAEIDALPVMSKYSLNIKEWGSTFMQYVYNTGRSYWRKEEQGYILSDAENAEVQQNFIAKCLALGYMLSKHKNSGQPYAVYAMEMTQGEDGEHLGGTGKSMFLQAVEQLRCQHYVDAQKLQEDKMQFMLQGVERNVTDTVFLDDVNHRIDLHAFMNMVTGKMVVDVKHSKPFTLEFRESPKIGFTSNHAIRKFDDSLNRRIWFAAFSDYYHSDSEERDLKLRSPRTEFGKDLIEQYTPEEMNHFYTFMFGCLTLWHRIHERVQPPMEDIRRRTLVKAMTEDFMEWANAYFTEDRLNVLVCRDDALKNCRESLNRKSADFLTPADFKKKLRHFCNYNGWVLNPDRMLRNKSDRDNNRILKKENGYNVEYFFIDTGELDASIRFPDDTSSGGGSGEPLDIMDQPPF